MVDIMAKTTTTQKQKGIALLEGKGLRGKKMKATSREAWWPRRKEDNWGRVVILIVAWQAGEKRRSETRSFGRR
jgi:hypothetical protein